MKIFYKKKFEKDYKKLSKKIKDQFGERLTIFMSDRYSEILNNHSVDPAYPDCRSINISGDYRAIFYEQDDDVTFITIGTHSQLYC